MPLLPAKLQRELVRRSKEILVKSNRNAPFRFAGKRAYDAMLLVIRQRFGSLPGVRAVYLCHSLAAGECYPGLSDFDLTIVFESDDISRFHDSVRRRWGSLKRYFPISDLSILTTGEFAAWQATGGGWDPLDEVRHWRLISGTELRRDIFDPSTEEASVDRMQWSLGHFQNLLHIAIKEEQQSPMMAIIARRQLHKCFWNAVLALDAKYLATPTHKSRVSSWMRDRGTPHPVADIQRMYAAQFLEGPVTTLRFEAAALAYSLLDESLANNRLLARPLAAPNIEGNPIPISNHAEVEDRARAMCASMLEMLDGRIMSVILGSTGTSRGYALYVVLEDGLTQQEIADALRDIRAIHRVFDDPWFNEHLPSGIPIVCSRMMFLARLQTGRSSLDYFDKFRRVIFGRDLYAEMVSARISDDVARERDWRREHLLYSLHLHQVYLAWLKPALHDYVTFYLPRLMVQRIAGRAPATAEEAVGEFSLIAPGDAAAVPRRMLDEYRGKDLDALLKKMDRSTFAEVWTLLRQGLHDELRDR